MKRKYVAVLLGTVLCAASAGVGQGAGGTVVFASESTAESESDAANVENAEESQNDEEAGQEGAPGQMQEMPENMVSGEVTAVGESTITVTTEDGDQEIPVTEETVITRQTMGGGAPSDAGGEAPGDMPSGEAPADAGGEVPDDVPSGEAPADAPEMVSSGETPADAGNEAPNDMPSGEAPGDAGGEAPGDMPSGEIPGDADGAPNGGMGGGQGEEITLADIEVGETVMISLDDDGNAASITVMSMQGGMGGGQPGGMGQSGVDSYDAVNDYTEDGEITGETLTSTGTDENVVHVSEGADVTISDSTVTRNSEDSQGGDNSSFYGVGAAILTTDGTVSVSDSDITTDASGAAGVFAYGDGVAYVADTSITTAQDTSGGIHAAGGGTLYAWDLDVETSGESAAAIRSDRGGGTMVVDGGSYTSNGVGSPAIYSTADIAVRNAELTANGSEAICIEGLNSIHLFDSSLTGTMSDDEQNDCTWNVILYQSMSGDSEVGNSTFEMVGGTLTAENGGMFYTTNTESTFILSGVNIVNAEDSEFFLRCTGNNNQRGWGTTGQNGADCHFTAISQEMSGDVIWDTISDLDFYMTDGSVLTGAVVNDESFAGTGGDGSCNLYIEEGSQWVVTGDSTLSSLSCEGTITDKNGSTVTVVGTDGTVYVEGDSSYTVTVDAYSESVDLSEASSATVWENYEVQRPENL